MDHSVRRYDFAPIQGHEVTDEGFLRVWCRAAKVGTQVYRRSDGSQVREYRPPEEVGKPDSLSTFGMKPVTWNHPPELLDSDNTKRYQIGYSGSQVRFNDGFVEVALTITDKDAIEKIKRRDAAEVSAGYKVDFDPTPGITPDGAEYHGVQRNIRVNHIAVVPRGRAGPEVRLLLDRMDSADAVALPSEESAFQSVPTTTGSPTMATVKLDGLELDGLSPDVAQVLSTSFKNKEGEINELKKRNDALEAELQAKAAELTTAEGRIDALEAEVKETRLDQAAVDALVFERLQTLQHLAPAFAEDFKFDGLDDNTLYAQAFENLTGSAPRADADPAYVRGMVDGLLSRLDSESEEEEEEKEPDGDEGGMEDMKSKKSMDKEEGGETARGDSTTALRNALSGVRRVDESPAGAYRMKLQEAWKQPLTATK